MLTAGAPGLVGACVVERWLYAASCDERASQFLYVLFDQGLPLILACQQCHNIRVLFRLLQSYVPLCWVRGLANLAANEGGDLFEILVRQFDMTDGVRPPIDIVGQQFTVFIDPP